MGQQAEDKEKNRQTEGQSSRAGGTGADTVTAMPVAGAEGRADANDTDQAGRQRQSYLVL